MSKTNKIAIILLAAGESKRMGFPKQNLKWDCRTLLEHCLRYADKSEAAKVYLVLGAHLDKIELNLRRKTEVVVNENWQEGISSSIRAGIEHAEQDGFEEILIMLADQPNVEYKFLNKLIETFKKSNKNIIATSYKNSFGVPAIFSKTYFNEIKNLKGDRGAQTIIKQHTDDVEIVIEDIDLKDIDTVEDIF